MTSGPDRPIDPLTPEAAMRTIARVTESTHALRVRTEGLTIALWGIIMAASYLTIVVPFFLGGGGGPPTGFDPANATFNGTFRRGPPPSTSLFSMRTAPLAWYLVGAVFTIGIWRSAALSFHTNLSTPRLVGTFVAWILVFSGTVVGLAYVWGGDPRSWHLFAWALVIGLLAVVNPLRFSARSRVAFGIVALSAFSMGAYAHLANFGGRDVGFLSGLALGVPALVTGLYLLYRG